VGQLVSINVGLPRDIAWRGEKVHTAIWKPPVQGRIAVRRLNVEGDGQEGSRRAWMRAARRNGLSNGRLSPLGGSAWPPRSSFGQFGENFTLAGLPDDEVCIGDGYGIRSALFEVTQPRVTCYRVGIGMAKPARAALFVSQHRPGFYFRLLEEG
jgi:MOSC domain-containing protein YiiM